MILYKKIEEQTFNILSELKINTPNKIDVFKIAEYLGVELADFTSIKAMFVPDTDNAYKILEVQATSTDEEIKKAYRRLAVMHHPDKVHHLGEEFQRSAQEKFKAINEAYEQIKKQRGIA